MNDSDLERRITALEEREKSNTHRLDDIEEKVDTLNRLTTAVEVMATEQKHQGETMGEIKKDVTALGTKVDIIEKKPGKRWEGVINQIIGAVVGALLALLLVRLGLPV